MNPGVEGAEKIVAYFDRNGSAPGRLIQTSPLALLQHLNETTVVQL